MNKKLIIISASLFILGLLFILIGFLINNQNLSESKKTPEANLDETSIIVKKVIDGDTIELSTGEKVRYIGIDTPETVDPRRPVACFGKEASRENKKLVEGKAIILEKDISETDKFGRLLRYVYLRQNDGSLLFINDYLVRNGFARVSTFPPDVEFQAQFVEAEKEARENQRGLWNKCTNMYNYLDI